MKARMSSPGHETPDDSPALELLEPFVDGRGGKPHLLAQPGVGQPGVQPTESMRQALAETMARLKKMLG